ncbi:hypothetical protein DSO57_1002709 [Entomophthora muscae]|uniref:Uncharacterized protein n=1 Tax=Entomophthora muscae TaxID=34485 RepID=A0ACC2UUH4_9FUNG|nr:hypothetical protein DSO57_1002709 [Entomophthora muscae]
MEAPPTPKPDRLHPTPGLSLPTANQYSGIAYITLAGLVDTMVPASGPWALVGCSASYLIKLAPLLWWALPSSQPCKLAAEANSPSPGMWYPDITSDWLVPKSFMSLKATPAANQESPPGEGTGLQPIPMITTLEQDNQVVNSRFLANERTPSPGTILLPLNPSTQILQTHISQWPEETPMENVKFRSGVLYRL